MRITPSSQEWTRPRPAALQRAYPTSVGGFPPTRGRSSYRAPPPPRGWKPPDPSEVLRVLGSCARPRGAVDGSSISYAMPSVATSQQATNTHQKQTPNFPQGLFTYNALCAVGQHNGGRRVLPARRYSTANQQSSVQPRPRPERRG